MTHLSEREYFDEYDNIVEIENILKRDRYFKVFRFLYNHFSSKEWITSRLLQEKLGITDHANAYQILESFRVLNMLTKFIKKNRAYYHKTNPEYWEEGLKIVEKQCPPENKKEQPV